MGAARRCSRRRYRQKEAVSDRRVGPPPNSPSMYFIHLRTQRRFADDEFSRCRLLIHPNSRPSPDENFRHDCYALGTQRLDLPPSVAQILLARFFMGFGVGGVRGGESVVGGVRTARAGAVHDRGMRPIRALTTQPPLLQLSRQLARCRTPPEYLPVVALMGLRRSDPQ